MKENKDQDTPKNSNQISYSIGFRKGKEKTINKACEVFAEMLDFAKTHNTQQSDIF